MQTAVPSPLEADRLPQPYLLFLGDTVEPGYAKTAFGLRDWARDRCVGEFACDTAQVSTGLPFLSPAQARLAGARAMVIGVANPGGRIPPAWIPLLVQALEAGLDLIGGMHMRLSGIETLRNAARAFRARGVDADFRATGQTGILIAGTGVPMDAVVADFAAGAAETLSPDAEAAHWDVIEGQGSLSHPAYAGVSLALLHGSQPDVIVVCHEYGRDRVLGYPHYALPSIEETISLALTLGARTNPAIRCAGISVNTSKLDPEAAPRVLEAIAERVGLPAADPIRGGEPFTELVDACLARGVR